MVEARCPRPQLRLIILPASMETIPHLSIITQRPPLLYPTQIRKTQDTFSISSL